jgi:hypothetical protein
VVVAAVAVKWVVSNMVVIWAAVSNMVAMAWAVVWVVVWVG